jgi:transglutaminase-like putative cysteine protease
VPLTYEPALKEELAAYLDKLPTTTLFKKYLSQLDIKRQRTIDFLVQINQRVYQDINYLIRMEPGVQTPEETLQLQSGSCRDSAWLLVQLLRNMGLAARFVSGYLIQLTPDVKSLEGPSGTEVDFTDLHAWCEVYFPGAGWIGLDPTSGLLAGEGHIPLACTPQPSGAAPIEGLMDEAVDPETMQDIQAVLDSFAHQRGTTDIIRFDHITTRRAGQRRFVDVHMHMPASWSLGRAAALRTSVEQALMSAVPGLRASIQLLPSDVEAHFDDVRDLK